MLQFKTMADDVGSRRGLEMEAASNGASQIRNADGPERSLSNGRI